MIKVDLHMHSTASDGTHTGEELVARALAKKVNYIAITDHNEIKESLAMHTKYPNYVILGCEISVNYKGLDLHLLAYNFEPAKELLDFIYFNKNELDSHDDLIIKELGLYNEEYFKYQKDPKKGGWKSVQYLLDKGVCQNLGEYFALFKDKTKPKFKELQEGIELIHKYGGKAILAHPGKSIPKEAFTNALFDIINLGIDGIECYYPKHDEVLTKYLVGLCQKYDLLITCGCDFHGEFQSTDIGELNVDIADLRLEGIIKS